MKLLVSLLLFLACTIQIVQAKTYVICIGVSDYPGKYNDLRLSINDAESIKALYDKFGHTEVVALYNSHATKSQVYYTMKKMYDKAREQDAIVFYFSGHGLPNGIVCYDGVLSYHDINKVMMRSKAFTKFVFADACFSGKARTTFMRTANKSCKDVIYFLSSRSNEQSSETLVGRNSLFTMYLEQGMKGRADINKDGIVTAKELFDFVRNGVINASKGQQHPVIWGNFDATKPILKLNQHVMI